jgi:hypothetical protein
MSQEKLFVVLHRPLTVTEEESAFSFLPSGEFDGANKKNTIWLGKRKKLDVSSVNYLTIIIPPGESNTSDNCVALAEKFSSKKKVLEKLTYVWVTDNGQKFKPSLVPTGTKYGRFPQFPGLNFKSVRLEASPSGTCLAEGVVGSRSLILSNVAKNVELCDIYTSHFAFEILEGSYELENMSITGNSVGTVFPRISFHGDSLDDFETHIKKKLDVTNGKSTVRIKESHINVPETKRGEQTQIYIDLSQFFSTYAMPEVIVHSPPIKKNTKLPEPKSKWSCSCCSQASSD